MLLHVGMRWNKSFTLSSLLILPLEREIRLRAAGLVLLLVVSINVG